MPPPSPAFSEPPAVPHHNKYARYLIGRLPGTPAYPWVPSSCLLLLPYLHIIPNYIIISRVCFWQAVRYSGVTLGAKLLLPGAEGFSPLWRLGAGEHLEWLRPLTSWAVAYTPPPASRSGEHLGGTGIHWTGCKVPPVEWLIRADPG